MTHQWMAARRRRPLAFQRYHLDLLVILLISLTVIVCADENRTDDIYENRTDDVYEDDGAEGEEEEFEPAEAVLFPWFTSLLGIAVFLLLSRFLHALPYTAVMFGIGTVMGVGAIRFGLRDQLTESILTWDIIDSEVLLLVFLPGLLFRDAFGLNVHLFQVSIWQCLNLAFPMVFVSIILTTFVGYYIMPYDWSVNLCMTFGSILSATDPVAVSALMNDVGAPPRLKMHISGESLLNDGSAMVFYSIFSAMFLAELGVSGLGQTFGLFEGLALFIRMAFGGAAIGVAFGFGGIFCLFCLNRRLNEEENVVQVAATVTIAYLTYYTAEVTLGTSGVIAVVMCGITTKAFGSSMINDQHMMESFWVLVEHLLNTVLFTLGGVVWGGIIGNSEQRNKKFHARDWGNIILLYILVMAIRFFLVYLFYPIHVRIGLKSNWQESVFLSFAGLRGAVGIALAISLDHRVWSATDLDEYRMLSTTLFGMVGGVAFMTLVINGTLSGPLLLKLGLADSTEMRASVISSYRRKFKRKMLDDFIDLLADPRFHRVDFALVRHHVPFLADLSVEEFLLALHRYKEQAPASGYKEPSVEHVLPYLNPGSSMLSDAQYICTRPDIENRALSASFREQSLSNMGASQKHYVLMQSTLSEDEESTDRVRELRKLFIELLKYAYETQMESGELDGRMGFVAYTLLQSLEFASDAVSHGSALSDWEASQIIDDAWANKMDVVVMKGLFGYNCLCPQRIRREVRSLTFEYHQLRLDVIRALAFIEAHRLAQDHFVNEFVGSGAEFTDARKLVRKESKAQVLLAEKMLQSKDPKDVENITSHFLCIILLNKAARYVESLAKLGLLKEREANEYLQSIQMSLEGIFHCTKIEHPGQIPEDGVNVSGSNLRHELLPSRGKQLD